MNKVKALVPRLRFPEFREAGDWEQVAFGKLGLDVSDGNYSAKYPKQTDFLQSGVPFLRANNLRFGTVSDDDMRFISERQHRELTKGHLKKGDILLSTRGQLGTIALVPNRHIGSNLNAQLVRINTGDILINTFLFQLMDYAKAQGVFDVLSTGTALKQLNILKLKIPQNKNEQQKIAECLTSLDEVIAAQHQKLAALKTHKKGLMQQLFPREGETLPRLRFPKFQAAGEWEPQTLGSVCSSFSGGTPSTSQSEYYGGDIPFIRSAEIDRDRTELFLTRAGLSNSAAKIVAKGDVLVALYGANSGDVALAKIEGAINQAILCLKSKESNAFIYQFLSFKKDWVVATYLQGGQGNLSGEIVKSISVCFPFPAEQQKIADCLSSIDKLITAQSQKLEALKTHKKGLMQQLFPSPVEVEA